MNGKGFEECVEILMVEDNPNNVRLATESFKKADIFNHLSVVKNKVKALAFLRKEGRYANVNNPDIILLDLDMPGNDDYKILKEIRNDSSLNDIPTFGFFNFSSAKQDFLRSTYSNEVKHLFCNSSNTYRKTWN